MYIVYQYYVAHFPSSQMYLIYTEFSCLNLCLQVICRSGDLVVRKFVDSISTDATN
jgi:hypothetical protein